MGFKVICLLGSLLCTYNFTQQRYNAQSLQQEQTKLKLLADITAEELSCFDKITRKSYEYTHTIVLNDIMSGIVNPILENVTISVIRAGTDTQPCLNRTTATLGNRIQTGLNDVEPCIRTYKIQTDAILNRVNISIANVTAVKENVGHLGSICMKALDRWNCTFGEVQNMRHVLETNDAKNYKMIYEQVASEYVECVESATAALNDDLKDVLQDSKRCIEEI